VVVVGVQPGPFGGDGFQSASIWRGDLIVSMNGQSLDAAGYVRLIRGLAAGDKLRVVYRRSTNPDPRAGVPQGDRNGEQRTVEIILDEADKWTGTVGRGLPPGRVIGPAQAGAFEPRLLATATELGLRTDPGGLDQLTAALSALQQRILDPNVPAGVVHALSRPLSLDRVEADLAAQVRPLAQPQTLQDSLQRIHRLLLRALDLPDWQMRPDLFLELAAARHHYLPLAVSLVSGARDGAFATGSAFPHYLQLMRQARELLPLSVATLPAVADHARDLESFAQAVMASEQPVPPELVEQARGAVTGTVLGARLIDGELWIVGGSGANRYDMDRIAAVFDVDGADVYTFSRPPSGSYQIVIDQAGDDLYESMADLAGPATGVFSVSVVDDRGGNDRYRSLHQGAIAVGLFGIGILIDSGGDDRYTDDSGGAGWSEGVGIYGAGLLIDRAGDDRYRAQILSQGVGGPGGIGLIVDGRGDDTYVANGDHFPSGYGTPGVFAGLSQGFGFGLRGYASGGVGALYDLAGNDHYLVGEFGQGTGYFQGLGILHDAAGNDFYQGSRYAQGSAAHQAAGILVDDAGDDTYSCIGAAGQGTAWDQSVAMLVDRAGNDTYFSQGIAQGSAAQEAIAVLVDLAGEDVYSCGGPCLGESADSIYHYDESKLWNFSALIDLGGRHDHYAQSRPDDGILSTGAVDADDPRRSQCCGLFVDE